MVKGLTVGTATDKNGNYVLRLPEMKELILIYSFVGMEARQVKYTGQDTINVVLRETVNEMDEVTVVSTGYQSVNRRDMVGSYTTVKAEDIMMPCLCQYRPDVTGTGAGNDRVEFQCSCGFQSEDSDSGNFYRVG